MRTQNLNILLLKPGVRHHMAIHVTLTAWNFFLAYFYPSGPFTCIFSQNLSRFFPVLAVANTGSCVGPQNKIGHPAGCRFPVFCAHVIEIGSKACVNVFLLLRSETEDRIWAVVWERKKDLWYNLVSWWSKPSQPQRITSGLNTNFTLSSSYSSRKSS